MLHAEPLTIELSPYPHFVRPDTLAADDIDRFLSVWPPREAFTLEKTGNLTHSVNAAPSDPVVWREQLAGCVQELTRTTVAAFAPWLVARFGSDLTSLETITLLMEADPSYSGLPIHNHHWHSPNWVATALVYLDPVAPGYAGTVLNGYGPADDPEACAQVFARTDMWGADPDFSIDRVMDYQQGSLFAFLDGPMSYHSTLAAAPDAESGRRVLRMHIAAPWDLCEAVYGVSEAEYCALHPRGEPATDPRVLEWVRRDLAEQNEQVAMSAAAARDWARSLDIRVPLPA